MAETRAERLARKIHAWRRLDAALESARDAVTPELLEELAERVEAAVGEDTEESAAA